MIEVTGDRWKQVRAYPHLVIWIFISNIKTLTNVFCVVGQAFDPIVKLSWV